MHRALGNPRDLFLKSGIIGELIDAFLADDGRIHVGDQKPLPSRLIGLDDNINLFDAVDRPARILGIAREAQVRRIAFIDPVRERRLGVDFAKQAEDAVDQPVIEPSRCYQRCDTHGRTQTSTRLHCRADRQRQVRIGARTCQQMAA